MKKIKLYDIHGTSAENNFKTLLTPDEKYFYWSTNQFTNYLVNDVVFWVNRKEKVALFTVIDSISIAPVYKDGKNIINDHGYIVSANAANPGIFVNFFRFKVENKIKISDGWDYQDATTFNNQLMAIKILEENIRGINDLDKKIEKIIDLENIFIDTPAFEILEDAKSMLLGRKLNTKPVKISKRNVWFVCQGESYDKERGMKYLWAPQKDKAGNNQYYWDNMLKVKAGDIIFNYADGIRGVSIAKTDCYKDSDQESIPRWGIGKGYKVDIELTEFSRAINYKELQNKKDQFVELLKDGNSPFDINGSVKQGYLFEFSVGAGRLVRDIYGKLFGKREIDDFFDQFTIKYISNLNKFMDEKILTAIKTKPFILLAGLSGTGKSRLARTLAYKTCSNEVLNADLKKPGNFELIPVKPNWHDSTELMGYVSRINGEKYIITTFLKFLAKAWKYQDVPFFLCLDEMNLAPVEQYFAEYLSILETRATHNGKLSTDFLISRSSFENQALYDQLLLDLELDGIDFKEGIALPNNLVVIGTVNMDETTHSFSRKVLDRAMTFEMNDVNLRIGLDEKESDWSYLAEPIKNEMVIGGYTAGNEVVNKYYESEEVLKYLEKINLKLEGSPFKIAYRVRDEFLIYCYYASSDKSNKNWLITALDEITSMKILSRIEGDNYKTEEVLNGLLEIIDDSYKITKEKLKEMKTRLEKSGYTSYWL